MIGSNILVDGMRTTVLGIIRFSSYSEYLVSLAGKKVWLEAGREWRLWRKTKITGLNTRSVQKFFKDTKNIIPILGEDSGINGFKLVEAGCAIVLGVKGETEDTGVGDKVFYLELTSSGGELFAVEVWNGEESEAYKGLVVVVEQI